MGGRYAATVARAQRRSFRELVFIDKTIIDVEREHPDIIDRVALAAFFKARITERAHPPLRKGPCGDEPVVHRCRSATQRG